MELLRISKTLKKYSKILISKVQQGSTLLRKEEVEFKTSELKEKEIDAGYFGVFYKQIYKEKTFFFLTNRIDLYHLSPPHNLFLKFCFCCKKE